MSCVRGSRGGDGDVLVMLSNNSKGIVHYLAGKHPGKVGHLYSPDGWRNPLDYIPYALDNGAWTAFKNGREWDAAAFVAMCERAKWSGMVPLWVAVPDVVADRDATLARWQEWAPRLAAYRWPLAFVVQDGMTRGDVPPDAAVVFVGGSTEWKRATLRTWCRQFPRVHVGRINTPEWLRRCEAAGAESVDGTGWFHDRQMRQLRAWMNAGRVAATDDELGLFE